MPLKNEFVKIRKEGDCYLVYFNELKKLIPVDYIGSKIINLFFNKRLLVNEIIESIDRKISPKNIRHFLRQIRNQLVLNPRGTFNYIKED